MSEYESPRRRFTPGRSVTERLQLQRRYAHATPSRTAQRILPELTGIYDGDRRWNVLFGTLLAVLLLFMPAAFGAVEAWSELVVLVGVLALTIGLAFRSAIDSGFRQTGGSALLVLVLFIGVITFQILPLPIWLVTSISPSTAGTWIDVHASTAVTTIANQPQVAPSLADHAGTVRHATLSLYPHTTAHMLRLVLIGVAIFTAVAYTFRRPKAIEWLLTIVFLIGCAQAALAVAQIATRSSQIYWRIGPPVGNVVTAGSFVHHSHFSQFMNLSLGAGLGLLLLRIQGGSKDRRFSKINGRHAPSVNWDKHGWLICGLVLCAVTILTSMSRNGAISMCIAAAVIGTALYFRGAMGTRGWVLVMVPFGVLGGLILFGFDDVYVRLSSLEDGKDFGGRWEMTAGTLRAWLAYPIWGTGLGTHEFVFPAFDPSRFVSIANSADNEYAQILEETGIVGAVLVSIFVLIIATICTRLMMKGKSRVSIAAFGLGYGLIAVAFHSLSDFGQRIPAVFCLTSVSCGLLVAIAHYEQCLATNSNKSVYPRGSRNWSLGRRVSLLALLISLAVATAWAVHGAYAAFEGERWRASALGLEAYLRDQGWQGENQDFIDLIAASEVACDWVEDNAEYAYWLNLYRWQAISRLFDSDSRQDMLRPEVLTAARRIADELAGIRLTCPTYGPPYALEGQIRLFVLDDQHGADLIQKGYRLTPNDPPTCLVAGELAARHQQTAIAVAALGRAVELAPAYYIDVAKIYVSEMGRPDLAQALAVDDHRRLGQLADLLKNDGRFDELAVELRRQADQMLRNAVFDEQASPEEYAAAARLEVRDGSRESAIRLYRRALAAEYGRVEWRLALARLLVDMGKSGEAVHEAKICLRLRPNHSAARRLIEELSATTDR